MPATGRFFNKAVEVVLSRPVVLAAFVVAATAVDDVDDDVVVAFLNFELSLSRRLFLAAVSYLGAFASVKLSNTPSKNDNSGLCCICFLTWSKSMGYGGIVSFSFFACDVCFLVLFFVLVLLVVEADFLRLRDGVDSSFSSSSFLSLLLQSLVLERARSLTNNAEHAPVKALIVKIIIGWQLNFGQFTHTKNQYRCEIMPTREEREENCCDKKNINIASATASIIIIID